MKPTAKLATSLRDTDMELIVGAVEGLDTTRFKGALVTPYNVAVMFVFPGEFPVTEPVAVMVAIMGAELAHFDVKVASSFELSEKVAIAVNCWVPFTDNLNGDCCSIVTAVIVTTGNVVAVELIPENDAVICVLPKAAAVTNPLEEMAATVVSELFQITPEVISFVDLSEYVPVAVNCWVVPS